MLRVLFTLLFSMISFVGFASEAQRNYVEGDGGLDIMCAPMDQNTKPYSVFSLKLFYDANFPGGGSLFTILTDSNLASGNGSIVYEVTVSQTPNALVEVVPATQLVPGCEQAPLKLKQIAGSENFEIYFECDGDGDAGYGDLVMDMANGLIEGHISFPEGQLGLAYPILEDTEIEVSCNFTGL